MYGHCRMDTRQNYQEFFLSVLLRCVNIQCEVIYWAARKYAC